jgi:hypothetical protein
MQNEVYCSSILRIQNHSAASLSFHKSSIKPRSPVTHTKHEALQPHPLSLSSLVLSNPSPSSVITPAPFHGIKTPLPIETPIVRTTYLDLPRFEERQSSNPHWKPAFSLYLQPALIQHLGVQLKLLLQSKIRRRLLESRLRTLHLPLQNLRREQECRVRL